MMIPNLKTALEAAAGEFLRAGGFASTAVIKALRDQRKKEYSISIFISVLVVCALIACIVILLVGNTQQARWVAGVLGIGSGGGLEVLRRVWKDWSQTDLLLILIEDANEAQVTTIVNKLIKKL